MSDTSVQPGAPDKGRKDLPPFPRTAGGVVLWVFIAAAMLGTISFSICRSGQRFKGDSRRWAEQEARTTIAKLHLAEEAYRSRHGVYLATTTRGEGDLYPAPGPEPRRRFFQPMLDDHVGWSVLTPAMPEKRLFCGYVVVAGPAGSLANAGPRGKKLFDNRPPPKPWYYIRAQCIQRRDKILIFESTSKSDRIFLLK
jgi:hypothetical protein